MQLNNQSSPLSLIKHPKCLCFQIKMNYSQTHSLFPLLFCGGFKYLNMTKVAKIDAGK